MTRNFITLVAIESRFEPRAKSSAGAVGLAQVIPKYAKEFGSHCGLVFEPSDMDIPELNLLAGACQFKHLVDTLGSTSLALVAYNAGRYSKSLKSMKLMSGAGNIETANYVAKHTYVKELTLGDNK
jgi:soluble lytic murein transglycosylase-like protein